MRKHLPVVVLALSLALSACSGEKDPSASASPPPSAAEVAYYDCLKDNGVPVVLLDNGTPRVDKDKPHETLPAAEAACRSKLPAPVSAPPAAPEVLAAAREESQCVRAEGISWYPDPDPVTGATDERSAPAEQTDEARKKYLEATRKCREANKTTR
ncbi:hypothetical protein [Streptomyces sp. NPDC001568]|uniref:hypothetical protein n=1 Tax=Streptomyces sp. NPDC001568 TaxID=3364588 RepID=UPI003679029B